MFAERGVTIPRDGSSSRAHRGDRRASPRRGRRRSSSCARSTPAPRSSGAAPTSARVGRRAAALLAQNWDWHPDLSASTVIWIVEHDDSWFATLTEAGILAKIGLNDAGLGVCLNILAHAPRTAA